MALVRQGSFAFVLVCSAGILSAQTGGFDISATPASAQVCSPNDAVYTVDLASLLGFSDPVTLSSMFEPAGTTSAFSMNPVTPPGSSLLTISNTGAAAPGDYLISIMGVSPTSTETTTVGLALFDSAPGVATLASPPDGASDVPLMPSLIWNAASQAGSYAVELSESPGFVPLVAMDTVAVPGLNLTNPLQPNTVYYWRVQPGNACGLQAFSAPFSFTTGTVVGTPPAVANFGLQPSPTSLEICSPNDAVYTVGIASFLGYSDPVTLSTSGEPAGATAAFSTNPVSPPGASQLTISGTGAAVPGNYMISIVGIAPTSTQTSTVSLALWDMPPGTTNLTLPPNGATGVPLLPTLNWSAAPMASSYEVELSDNPAFAPLVLTSTVMGPSFNLANPLSPNTTYYWRVLPLNACGGQSVSEPFAFTTGSNLNQIPTIPMLSPTGMAVLLLALATFGLYMLR